MKTTVTRGSFVESFRSFGRLEQFSARGLQTMFDYFEQLEADTGEEIELDVIGICCEWCEYDSFAAFVEDYDTYCKAHNIESVEDLAAHTTVLEIEGTDRILVQAF